MMFITIYNILITGNAFRKSNTNISVHGSHTVQTMLSCILELLYRKYDLHSTGLFKKSMEIFDATSHKSSKLQIVYICRISTT